MLVVSLFLDTLFVSQHYESFEARPFDYVRDYLPLEARRLPTQPTDDLDITQELPAVVC